MKPLILCILDGVGIRKEQHGNAVYEANMPNFDRLMMEYPHSLLDASEEYVGLPHNQMGNSEVGHSNIGAGRIVYQPQQLINEEIKNKQFFQNKNILEVINHTKTNNSKLHILGLLSDGGIHSDINHLLSLIDMCKANNIKNLYFHLFLDGRDTLPKEAIKYIEILEQKIKETNIGEIATISGRYYAMDRDNRWDRIEKAYKVIVGNSKEKKNYKKHIESSYKKNITDEFIEPILVNKNGILEDNDGLIVFNYRPDRLRELFKAITNSEFKEFEHKTFNNIKLVTMFGVSEEVICTNAYQKQTLENTLGIYLSKKKLKQLRIAETEKYAHVTYFFDGGKELDLEGKKQILIPSPKVSTYDLKPEMSAYEITDQLLNEMNKYDVIILNFANGDMVGHTGKMDATIKALEHLDICLGKIYDKVKELKGTLIVTADHGNSDTMLDENNNPITSHSMSKVPFIITNKKIKLKNGKLADIAPTMLKILNLDIPKEMTGKSLIKEKHTISNIFIIISLMFLCTLGTFYTTRLIKFYKLENPSITVEDRMLIDEIKQNIVTSGSGLYHTNNEFIYKGKVENNYLLYSGILFRIIKINNDNSIKLITEESITNLKYNGNYKTSDIRKYLNDNGLENTGQFYNNLITPDNYLKNATFCLGKIAENKSDCSEQIIDKVGLLGLNEYIDALGNESYLNNGNYYWLIDGTDKGYYVFSEGGISNDTPGYYGIRPVINLKENTKIISGNGTFNDPYKIENTNVTIGKYIKYSNYVWKIINIEEDSYKLAMTNLLDIDLPYSTKTNQFNLNDKTSIAYYLNHTFYDKLDKTYLIEKEFKVGSYHDNYLDIYKEQVKANVGMMNIADLYVNDFSNYTLLTPATADMIYTVKSNNRYSTNFIEEKTKIRPVIYINKNINLNGNGSEANPFEIS